MVNENRTQSVRISLDTLDLLKVIKKELGTPISRFIEDAVFEKAMKLPKKSKEKIKYLEWITQ